MAKTIENVRVFLTSANTEFDTSSAVAEYRVVDGDLSKRARISTSEIDFNQVVSGYWDDVVSEINTTEGI
jgi:hypothetical protein